MLTCSMARAGFSSPPIITCPTCGRSAASRSPTSAHGTPISAACRPAGALSSRSRGIFNVAEGNAIDQRVLAAPNLRPGRRTLNPMQLRTVTATRYVTPLREGGSLPAVVEADDDGLYVLKFRGAGQGPRALIAEFVAGRIARAAE